jgi:hypothetical protein
MGKTLPSAKETMAISSAKPQKTSFGFIGQKLRINFTEKIEARGTISASSQWSLLSRSQPGLPLQHKFMQNDPA